MCFEICGFFSGGEVVCLCFFCVSEFGFGLFDGLFF